MSNRFFDWIFDHFIIVMVVMVIIGVIVTLAIYHDPRCLVAKCVIVKH